MTEDHQFRSGQILTFASGKPGFRTFVLAGFIALLTIVAFITGNSRTVAPPENAAGLVVVFIFFASLLFLKITRQWTAEIDLDTRRLRIFRVFFGRWRRDIVDCSLDECAALGMIEYDNDGHFSYGVYVRLKSGARHAIPLPSFPFMGPSHIQRSCERRVATVGCNRDSKARYVVLTSQVADMAWSRSASASAKVLHLIFYSHRHHSANSTTPITTKAVIPIPQYLLG